MSAENTPTDGKPRSNRARIAGILSTVFWVLGIILTFATPSGSPFIFLGDAFLLLGFWPLLWLWRPGWPWIIFGGLNIFIGFFLELAYHLPETNFTHEMVVVRNHLRDQHSAITWILIGAVSLIYGVGLTTWQIVSWIMRKMNKKQEVVS